MKSWHACGADIKYSAHIVPLFHDNTSVPVSFAAAAPSVHKADAAPGPPRVKLCLKYTEKRCERQIFGACPLFAPFIILQDKKIPKTLVNKAFGTFRSMRKMGLEPTQPESYKILSLARLPVPTLPHSWHLLISITTKIIILFSVKNVNIFF